jgi:hypothetical protein
MALNLKAVTTRLGYQQITTVSSAVGLTVPTRDLNGMNCKPAIALIVAEGAAVRWRDDDVDPSASIGMPLAIGVTLQYDGDLGKIKFIEQAASAKINISYYA